MSWIVTIGDTVMGRRYALDQDCLVGRSPECHICIVDEQVSRQHARLKAHGGDWVVEDLGSRNGVLVNGEKIQGTRLLKANDCLSIGPYLLLFEPDFKVLPDDGGAGAAVVAPDTQTLTSHSPVAKELLLESSAFDDHLLAELGKVGTDVEPDETVARLAKILRGRFNCGAVAILAAKDAHLETVCMYPKDARVAVPQGVLDACQQGRAVLVGGGVASPRIISGEAIAPTQTTATIPLVLGKETVGFAHFARPEGESWSDDATGNLARCAPVLALAIRWAEASQTHTRRRRQHDFVPPEHACNDILGTSKVIQDIRSFVSQAAPAPSPILVTGETGTGKELIAKALHEARFGKDAPFVAVNCGAVPEHLLESEFFGHEKGAFSGATQRKLGLFEVATGGTLFLDEVGELPMGLQVKLLRALEQREFYRLGGVKPVAVDFRLVAATHRDLAQMVQEGTFRSDLMYRIDVLRIESPPLKARPEDVPLLFARFLQDVCDEMGKPPAPLSLEGQRALRSYPWPGNVRELRNVAERVAVFCTKDQVSAETVRKALAVPTSSPNESFGELPLAAHVARVEMARIDDALAQTQYNKAAAARLLGISRPTLDKKIRDYNLSLGGDEQ